MTRASRRVETRLERIGVQLLFVLSLILFAVVAHAQPPATKKNTPQPTGATLVQLLQQSAGQRRIQARRINEEIKIDGLLNESAWPLAQPASDFLQEQPNEGAPASEKTEVRVLFDDRNLYIGIRAFDSDAAHINARELVRDADFSNDDKIEILLDTYHDKRNAFQFAVNPLGTQQDALITDEGRDVNVSWDGSCV